MTKRIALYLILAAMSVPVAQAQDLPALVTGDAWQVKAPNGREVEMTFNADGTGQMKAGPMSGKLSWAVRDGAFCIDGVPGGGTCMSLSLEGNDVIGMAPDGNRFVFKRA